MDCVVTKRLLFMFSSGSKPLTPLNIVIFDHQNYKASLTYQQIFS